MAPDYLMADITHPLDLLPAFDWAPDVVFLLAASVGRMTCEQAGSLAITTNLAGINNVLQLCKRTGSVCVYFSTSEVYGPACEILDDRAPCPSPTTATACRSGWASSWSSTRCGPANFARSPCAPA